MNDLFDEPKNADRILRHAYEHVGEPRGHLFTGQFAEALDLPFDAANRAIEYLRDHGLIESVQSEAPPYGFAVLRVTSRGRDHLRKLMNT